MRVLVVDPVKAAEAAASPLTRAQDDDEDDREAEEGNAAAGVAPASSARRGLRVEYRVRWKDGAPDSWETAGNLSPDLVRDFEERWWSAARKADLPTLTELLAASPGPRPAAAAAAVAGAAPGPSAAAAAAAAAAVIEDASAKATAEAAPSPLAPTTPSSGSVLAQVVDENRRSALHFVAAVGNADAVRLLVAAGADVDAQDKDGFTPLHMASGYMRIQAIAALLEAGADPELRDSGGRDVVSLVDSLRASSPLTPATIQRRMALEGVAGALTARLYEEVEPLAILAERRVKAGGEVEMDADVDEEEEEEGEEEEKEGAAGAEAAKAADDAGKEEAKDKEEEKDDPQNTEREFLVQFADGYPDAWVPERDVAQDLLDDWDKGLEQAACARLIDARQYGTARAYLVQWTDGSPDSWEPEEHVPDALVQELRAQRPELFKGTGKKKKGKAATTASA